MSVSYPERKSEIPLDSNENLLIPDEYYKKIKDKIDFEIRKYPSPTGKEVKEGLAAIYDVQDEQIVVGNGSDAILDTLIKTFIPRDGTIGCFTPSYEMYKFFASRNKRNILEIPLEQDFTFPRVLDEIMSLDALLICSPNNPTGIPIEKKMLRPILDQGMLVIIDEAYVEFSDQDFLSLLQGYDNLILVRTFSKAWGLAGIRFGYAISSKKKGIKFLQEMLPYNVNSISLQVAQQALKMKDTVDKAVKDTIIERERLSEELKIMGFEPISSDTNFILSKVPSTIDANDLFKNLLENGIRIRVFDKPELKGHVRITVGDTSINKFLIDILKEII